MRPQLKGGYVGRTSMTEASRIAELIRRQLPALKAGSLRFWGQWFGRPMDNIHTVTGASADGETLQVRFEKGETLRVIRPVAGLIGPRDFRIDDAAELRWEWNAYGNPPGRRYFEAYIRNGNEIAASTDVDWYFPDLRPSVIEPAVVIL